MILADWAERRECVEICRRLYQRGLISGTEGNVSCRLGKGTILCTPTGRCKGFLRPEDLVEVELDGRCRTHSARPSTELEVHLALYRARADVRAVVHVHGSYILAFAMVDEPLPEGVLAEAEQLLGTVKIVPFRPPGTQELAQAVAAQAEFPAAAFLLRQHGAVLVGSSLEEAWVRAEVLEAYCKALWLARQLGPLLKLPVDVVAELRRRMARPLE
jgi:L-fuculose-phosphate aldolase